MFSNSSLRTSTLRFEFVIALHARGTSLKKAVLLVAARKARAFTEVACNYTAALCTHTRTCCGLTPSFPPRSLTSAACVQPSRSSMWEWRFALWVVFSCLCRPWLGHRERTRCLLVACCRAFCQRWQSAMVRAAFDVWNSIDGFWSSRPVEDAALHTIPGGQPHTMCKYLCSAPAIFVLVFADSRRLAKNRGFAVI